MAGCQLDWLFTVIRKQEKGCVQSAITGLTERGRKGSKYLSKAGGLSSSDTNESTCHVILLMGKEFITANVSETL